MANAIHPAAVHHLPHFITAPGDTDRLMVIVTVGVIASVLGAGIFFLWLHSLPERMMHKAERWQFELVAVLGLLSLFTHIHAFWVAALLLAIVKIPRIKLPKIGAPLQRIVRSLEQLAEKEPVKIELKALPADATSSPAKEPLNA